jgi:hypothetical protein
VAANESMQRGSGCSGAGPATKRRLAVTSAREGRKRAGGGGRRARRMGSRRAEEQSERMEDAMARVEGAGRGGGEAFARGTKGKKDSRVYGLIIK